MHPSDTAPQGSGGATGQAAGNTTALPTRTRVVIVRSRKALHSGYDADLSVLATMLTEGLRALLGPHDPATVLARLLGTDGVIGLKVNCLAGRQAATHVELVHVLSQRLQAAGIRPTRQVVFDKAGADLVAAGFDLGQGRLYLCQGNDALGYEEEPTLMPSSASRLPRLLTEKVTTLINLPVLKQHMLAGITGALKNHFGCIDNPNKMHIAGCDPYIAEVNALPAIRSKQRLIVMDALRPVIDMGPSYQPGLAEPYHGLLLGTDPVAIDTVGIEILDELRRGRKLPPLAATSPGPVHVQTAARMGLGIAERSRIEILRLEV